MSHITLKDLMSGTLALLVTLTLCMIYVYEVVQGRAFSEPAVLSDGFFAIVAFFLGGNAVTNGARAAGAAAAQTAIAANQTTTNAASTPTAT